MTDKTIKITDVPDGEWRERVLAMANAAKWCAFGGGVNPLPPDHVFIRAAMSMDYLMRHQDDPASLAVCLIAGQFDPEVDGDPPARADLLRETLVDPGATLADECANNRRLLGLDSTKKETE